MREVSLTRETKNKLLLSKLVRNYWGLTEEGYKLFRHRLLFDRPIAKEYKEIIGDSHDLRKRIALSGEEESVLKSLRGSDKGYEFFRMIYADFCEKNCIDYSHFNKGRFIKNKNEVKLFKGIRSYYFETLENFYDKEKNVFFVKDIQSNLSFFELNKFIEKIFYFIRNYIEGGGALRSKIINYLEENLELANTRIAPRMALWFNKEYSEIKDGEVLFFIDSEKQNYFKIKTMKELKDLVEFFIKETSEIIGKYKIPKNNNLELVISLNPVDWLLCSTGEKWSSCLNLQGNYMFWVGIPTMIGDKNRALVYITDGSKKTYMGMEVDKFLTRSWMLLARKKTKKKQKEERNETFFEIVREYPCRYGIGDMIKRYLNLNVNKPSREGVRLIGKYYVETIPFLMSNIKVFASLYLDDSFMFPAKKNKAKYKAGEYMFYKIRSSGGGIAAYTLDSESKETYRANLFFSEDIHEDAYNLSSDIDGERNGFEFIAKNGFKLTNFVTLE